jgi:peptide/nickel transport system substrate-binding protein
MKSSRPTRLTALVLAIGLSVTGCAAGGSSSSEPTETLRLAAQNAPTSFAIGNWAGGETYLFTSVYDTIVTRDVDGTLIPAIAESWEYSNDNTVLTLKIRDGQTFTDGEALDAAAVVASLEVSRTAPATSGRLASISTVEAVDPSTVTITLSAADAALLPTFSTDAGAVGAPEKLTDESSQLNPVGSGPYTLDQSATTVGSTYTLKRNPSYWDKDSYPFQTVTVQVIPDPTAVQNALQSGQIDYAGATPETTSIFSDTSKYTVGSQNPQAIAGLWLADRAGTVVPELADLRVRQAINLALDREGVAENIQKGSNFPSNQIFNPNGKAFDKDRLSDTAYNVTNAKQLLADAGYADGFSVTMPSTFLSTTYESTISQQLADIGITVTWETVPFQDFYSKVFAGNYGMFFLYNGFGGDDSLDAKANLSGVFNPFNTTTPELETLLKTANAAPTEDQGAAFQAVNKYLVDQAWFAPLGYTTGSYVASTSITYTPAAVASLNLRPFTLASK